MNTKESILTLFGKQKELSVKEITDRLGSSKQMVHLVLKKLLEAGVVEKFGRTPKTIYRVTQKKKTKEKQLPGVTSKENEFLKKNFLLVTESGELREGISGFGLWCEKRQLPTESTLKEFMEAKAGYDHYYTTQGTINGIDKLKNTKAYDKVHLDHLFYLDFYAIERYGKTRLGTLLHYAKQGQNKFLMKIMMDEIRERIISFVAEQGADAVAFVPPTIRREVQIMKFIREDLRLPLPVIEIKKLGGIIPIPQKTLGKLEDRITNAENTYSVTGKQKFRHVVLIDDEANSGATLNQVAEKIKNKQMAKEVSGLAITGHLKGFDVSMEMNVVSA
jgi:DNA-binding transcriptional ArsR family regulator